MRIESYSVAAYSAHLYLRRESVSESLRIAAGRSPSVFVESPTVTPSSVQGPPPREIAAFHRLPAPHIRQEGICQNIFKEETDARLAGLKTLVEKLVEALTGKKIHIRILDFPRSMGVGIENPDGDSVRARFPSVEYRYTHQLVEEERTVYAASGKVGMVDGSEMSFNLVLSMERERVESESVLLRSGGELVDPLVVVLDGSHARLSEKDIVFDLNMDGAPDRMPVPAPGSGFLVLDLNEDGRVDNGSELFGPRTGNGFYELSLHDLDGNGWIDEADPVFRDLRVWVWEQDADRLYTLPELDIGALYLRGLETPFTLSVMGSDRGRITSTSFWLGEDGKAGLVQHLDFFL